MSNPNPPAIAARAPRYFVSLAVLLLAGYAIFLALNTSTVAGGADSSGYLNSARLLASGHRQAAWRLPTPFLPVPSTSRLHFSPHGFYPTADNPLLPPTYPSGLPLHYAAAGLLLGWTAGPLAVSLLAAVGTLCLFYLIARELALDRWLAVAGAVCLASFPPLIFSSIQPLSDVLATAWCLAAVFAALRASPSAAWSLTCGFALSIAVLVRPTNVLLYPSLLILVGPNFKRIAALTLAGLPGALWFATYNHTLYGGVFRSGYPGIETAFAPSYAWPTILHFGRTLALFLPAALLVLPLIALVRRATRTRLLTALATWFFALTAPYVFYAISQEDWSCLRFILPALPALIFAALLGVNALTSSTSSSAPRIRLIAATILSIWAFAASWHWTRKLGVLYIKGYEQPYATATAAARTKIPSNAVIVCGQTSGAVYYYTDFPVLRWDFINATEFARYASLARSASIPLYAAISAAEEDGVFRDRCPGEWIKLSTHGSISLWRLVAAAPAPIAK